MSDLDALAARVRAAAEAAEREDGHRPDFAEQLFEFALALLDHHEFEDAAAASAEATRQLAWLAERDDARWAPVLARALRLHADAVVELGLGEQALEVYHRAAQLFADYAPADPSLWVEFAGNALNTGECLRRLGRRDQALQNFDLALKGFQEITFGEGGDGSQLPNVALAQLDRGKVLLELERGDEAIAAIEQAVEIDAALAERLPDRFTLAHAEALDILSVALAELGRNPPALEVAERALRIITALARDEALAYVYPLARMTNNFGRRLHDSGQLDESAEVLGQAVTAFELLAQAQPRVHQDTLARVLANRSNVLAELGRHAQAYDVAQRAIELTQDPALVIGGRRMLARLAFALDRRDDAIEQAGAALRGFAALLEQEPAFADAGRELAKEMVELVRACDAELPADAVALLEQLERA
jgi:tetratricopeptide (TPR) repeat protein